MKTAKFSKIALSMVLLIALAITSLVLASGIDVAVVDVTVPANTVTLAPGESAPIVINLTVTGNQAGTATFEVYRDWTLSSGVFTGSNPQEFTVPPRAGGDPATTFTTTGTVAVAAGQPAGPFTLTVGVFDITNSNATGAKLAAGKSGTYGVVVTPPPDATPPAITYTLSPATPDGLNGWYTGDVTLTWIVTEPETPNSLVKTGCADQVITTDGPFSFSCSATSTGGTSGPVTVSGQRDATPPQITLLSQTAANAAGWNNSDVTVVWTCSDSGSGVAAPSVSQTVTAEGANQSVTGACADLAGNTAVHTVSGINIDKTAPVASAVALPAANENGWNSTDVTVTFSATDALSGVASCTDPVVLANEGTGLSASGSCTDYAGNVSQPAAVTGIKIDKTYPTAALSVTAGTPGLNGWYTTNVTITTSGTGGISGFTCTPDQFLTEETTGAVFNGSCISGAGLAANAAPLTVKLDKTGPSDVVLTATGTTGLNDWYISDVSIATTGSELVSGPASCTPVQALSTDTAGATFQGSCTNEAGLSTNAAPLTIKRDVTPPTITGAPDRAANGYGWYNDNVTVSFTCNDGTSGVGSCTAPVTLGEGEGQSVAGSVTDNAGNTANTSVNGINVDKTAPVITGTVDRPANANGWYKADVTVSFSCEDGLSGIATCTGNMVLGEGANQNVPGTAVDKAGNSAIISVGPINIDKTAPVFTAALDKQPAANGWFNQSTGQPTVSFTCSDALSGLDGSCPAPYTFGEGADQSHILFVADLAGNIAYAGVSNVDVDTVAPSVSVALDRAPASSGWYNLSTGAPVAQFTCLDETTGVAFCPADYPFGEGGNLAATGTAMDVAGNTASVHINNVKVDLTAPAVTWTGGPEDGSSFYFGSVPAAPTCAAVDALSGPNSCNVTGYSAAVGTHTMTATAYDVAGNVYEEKRTFTVLAWALKGFYQPVDMGGVLNVVKTGSTVPLKFEIFAGSNELTDVAAVKSLTYAQVSCNLSSAADEIETLATGSTVLRYDPTGGQFIYNWKTSGKAGLCYRVTMTTQDGSMIQALFRFK